MNLSLFLTINSWAGQSVWLDRLMVFSAEWMGYLMILGVLVFLVRNPKKWKEMFLVILGSAIVSRFGFVTIIRWFYYHPRPFMALQNVHQLIPESSSSFPSGHAAFYFALAAGLYFYNKKAGVIYLILAGLMGFARIYVGVHWPFDILAGAMLGVLTVVVCYRIILKSIQYFPKIFTGSPL